VKRLSLLLPLLLIGSVLGALPTTSPATVAAASTSYQPALPVNASVFYAVQRASPTRVHPTKPAVVNDVEVIRQQVLDMQYAGQQVGLYSWLGRGSYPDQVFGSHLRGADDTTFRWAILNENEGHGGNPSSTAARADLDWIYSRYGSDPNYFRIGGKPVMFLYGDAGDTCNAAARWEAADSAHRFYIVMKTVSGFAGCRPQPQGWYGYAPANGHWAQGNSYAVSPGFNKVGESGARLGRSVSRFASDLRAMKAAKVRFKITTTWNEWMEATGVETAREWASRSGHGAYVDQMHSILGQATSTPAPPTVLNASVNGQDVTLTWNASAGATSYQVFRNGCLVATVSSTSWTDSALADASGSWFVKAANFRGTSRRGPVRMAAAGTPTAAAPSARDGLVAIAGERVLSTSDGAGVGCSSRQRGQAVITMPASVPANATAAVLTVHAVNPLGGGTLQLFPAGASAPPVSQLRYFSTRASSNTVVVPIGTGRQIVVQEAGAATHLWIDVIGYAAPSQDGLVSHSPGGERFLDTRSGLGGVPKGAHSGTLSAPLPSYVPDAATAVEVRLLITGASSAGTATVFEGAAPRPAVTSLAYAPSVNLTTSVLVPINASSKTVQVFTSSAATVVLGVEGWVVNGGHVISPDPAVRLVASTARTTSTNVTFPAAAYGRVVLLNVGVASALGYGNLSVTPDGDSNPVIQTMSFGPQQPQSGFVWVRVPANGIVHVTLTSGALLYVDELAVA
jgi:hypothetical protein